MDNFLVMRTIDLAEWKRGLFHRDKSLSWTSDLPRLPDEWIQKAFTSKSYSDAFLQAFEAVEMFVHGAQQLGCSIHNDSTLLDFGCGWGRITQAAYRYFDPRRIIAADVQKNALGICENTGLNAKLILINNQEALDLPDNSLDFVFSYSVFSHLSEKLHKKWLKELHRVLVPGGCLALTTRAENMIRHAMALSEKGKDTLTSQQAKIVEAFSHPEIMISELEKGSYVFRSYKEVAKNLDADYGEAFIPEKYVARNWVGMFPNYVYYQPNGAVDQAVVIARKS